MRLVTYGVIWLVNKTKQCLFKKLILYKSYKRDTNCLNLFAPEQLRNKS